MTQEIYNIYENIIQATSSELNIFFVIVAIVLAVVVVPLCGMVLKYRKEMKKGDTETEVTKHNNYLERESKMIERERQILEVIKENSTVIAGLKVTLESSGEATKTTLERIHTRIDAVNAQLGNIATITAQNNVKTETSLTNNIEMASKVNKILLIVDKLPSTSAGH